MRTGAKTQKSLLALVAVAVGGGVIQDGEDGVGGVERRGEWSSRSSTKRVLLLKWPGSMVGNVPK